MANWQKIKQRGNVEDRRSWWVVQAAWWVTVTGILLVLAVWYFWGEDQAFELLEWMQNQPVQEQVIDSSEFAGEDEYEVFSSTVLGSNDALWKKIFSQNNIEYQAPRLVLFRGSTVSWCWTATSAIWPHYCPADKTIYLDETFFEELTKKFWAKGWDVAEAYVIAHEVAHHVQNILWISWKVHTVKRNWTTQEGNAASVKLELQADCLAWIWASSISWKGILEKNEISEAIDAAEAVWDDRIQEAAYWETHPETWTHGSSADRKKWFNIWYEHADFQKCDTFQ